MEEHLKVLAQGKKIGVPIYDFATHTRRIETTEFPSKRVIIVDGILILSQLNLLPHFDIKIFIDCPEKTRFERRLERDVRERGRTAEGVKAQFEKQVRPMHDQFVETSKDYADVIVSQEKFLPELNDLILKLKN
jgi:uridine kinase